MQPTCPLCGKNSEFLYKYLNRNYFRCSHCKSAFVDPLAHLSYEEEESRYLEHNNDVNDPGYRNFVKPILEVVFDNFGSEHMGLDFGAGTGPVISQVLSEKGYNIDQYDPFFCNKPEVLSKKYDYIVCCEVIEHFYKPHSEFAQLKSMLQPGGKLICMTDIFYDCVDFAQWYYKNDPTHVFFYHPQSIDYIEKEFGFFQSSLNNRTIWFSR